MLIFQGVEDYSTCYIGIVISQYKDPYQAISITECHKGFERCSYKPMKGLPFAVTFTDVSIQAIELRDPNLLLAHPLGNLFVLKDCSWDFFFDSLKP